MQPKPIRQTVDRRGSLFLDWDSSYTNKQGTLVVPPRKVPLKEDSFEILCTGFKDSFI